MSYEFAPRRVDESVDSFAGVISYLDIREISAVRIEAPTQPRSMLIHLGQSPATRLVLAGVMGRWIKEQTPIFVIVEDGKVRFVDEKSAVTADLVAAV